MTLDPDKKTAQIHAPDESGIAIVSFGETKRFPPLPIGGSPCPDYPSEYYFLQNSNRLQCHDKSKKEIQLPFTIETGLGVEKPKIQIDKINSFIAYRNQSTFDVYISSNIQEGKYEKHKSKVFFFLSAYL